MACLNYCDEEFGTHNTVDCGAYLPGGVSGIILVLCGTEIADPSSQSEVQAAIDAGGAILINGVTFDIARGSDQTVTNPVACGDDIKINAQNTANLFDGNVTPENMTLYNALDGKSISQIIANDCETDYVTFIDPPGPISVSTGFVSPASNSELQRIESVFTWKGKGTMTKTAKPAGIFG